MSHTQPRIKFPAEEINYFLRKGIDLRKVNSLFEFFSLLEQDALLSKGKIGKPADSSGGWGGSPREHAKGGGSSMD